MKTAASLFAILTLTLSLRPAVLSADFSSAEQKFAKIESNSVQEHPSPEPTTLSDAELNAYLNEGGVELPQGVEHVSFSNAPGVVTGTARIDFDKVTAGRRSRSMWMLLFTGVHDVKAVANAKGEGGMGEVHIQSMELDGIDVPRPALEYLVEHYIKPKYGNNVGLDSRFKMPARIDRATVGKSKVTLEQK